LDDYLEKPRKEKGGRGYVSSEDHIKESKEKKSKKKAKIKFIRHLLDENEQNESISHVFLNENNVFFIYLLLKL
jgi:hypothetical protein